MSEQQEPRWYCVKKNGKAMLCLNREDAKATVNWMNVVNPKGVPHRVMQLVDATEVDRLKAGVERMKAEIDALKSPWIAVSDRLPAEEDGDVLADMGDGLFEIAWVMYWNGASNDFAQWMFRDPDEDRTPVRWMRIPK